MCVSSSNVGWLHPALDLVGARLIFQLPTTGDLVSARSVRARPVLGGHEIVEFAADIATLRTADRSELRFRRRSPARAAVRCYGSY